MRTIGLIGGMSWESSIEYYRIINEAVKERLGKIEGRSKARYREIMGNLVNRGAQGIVLGCTEIGLLVGAEDSSVPVFDTTKIHAETAVEYALA